MSVEKEVKRPVVVLCSDDDDDDDDDGGTPLRPIFCLKKKRKTEETEADMSRFEQLHDCFILDFDPFEDSSVRRLSTKLSFDDVSVVAERGMVACRDYAHSRHLCLKCPFDTTPHENYCEMCYCYVCDSVAPCKFWNNLNSGSFGSLYSRIVMLRTRIVTGYP